MQIAVLSDIHDNIRMLSLALNYVQSTDAMVCCGDLCSPFVLDMLARGYPAKPLHIIFGNNDADLFRITAKSARYPHVKLHGEFFAADFEGRRIAGNHFNEIAMAIVRSDEYDAVFFGHNHIFHNAVPGKRTLALNPGSIMGCQFDAQANPIFVAPTFAIYDTATNSAEGYCIEGAEVRAYPSTGVR